MLAGCATNNGELAMRIETPQAIARLEFFEATTEQEVHVAGVPAGGSTQVAKAPQGQWCLVRYVVAIGGFGRVQEPATPICAEVRPQERTELGTLVFDGHGLTRADPPHDTGVPPRATPDDDFTPAGPPDGSLTAPQIKATMVRAKPEVRRCMSEHGLPVGTKIHVVLEIEGETGRVFSSSVRPPFADPSLEACVSAAVGPLQFPTFPRPTLGVSYPFVL